MPDCCVTALQNRHKGSLFSAASGTVHDGWQIPHRHIMVCQPLMNLKKWINTGKRGCCISWKVSQATAPKIMLFGVRDASDRCHPAFSAPFVRTLTDILRCLTKCSIRWFDQAKIIRFFSEGKGVFPFSLTVSYGGVCWCYAFMKNTKEVMA